MSQAIVDALFRVAPEFKATDSDTLAEIDAWILDAQRYVNGDIFGDEYNVLVAYKCAELMTGAKPIEAITTGQGEVLEETVDNAKYKYASAAKAKADREKHFADQFEKRLSDFCYIEEGPV